MASSSSSQQSSSPSASQFKYDVFLSFRGPDTRKGITSTLHHELQNRGIKAFMDDRSLEPGTEISLDLLTAIKESRSAVAILSPDYASSGWCLEELANIVEGLETRNTVLLPVFYNVQPCDVRHQIGSFKEAISKHEGKNETREKVKRWKAALTKVGNILGLESIKYKSDMDLVKEIVQVVCSKLPELSIESTGGECVEFEATKHAIGKVMQALKGDGLTAIGIYGMGGVGKTTLVKHVAAEAKMKGLFSLAVIAFVSQKPVISVIQGTLAEQMGIILKEETDQGRAKRLHREIMSKNRILIILDDIWKKIDLSSIGIPSFEQLHKCESKLLLTSRSLEICNSMDSQLEVALSVLSKDDSWSLFVREGRISSEKTATFYNVAKSVAAECAGLPIALVVIARALRDKTLKEWEDAAHQLKLSQYRETEERVFKCIKLSYDYLTSENAKSVFLLCCLFPEDHDIESETILAYGIGKGLFQTCNTLRKARAVVRSEVSCLISSSLLLGTKDDGWVRMHDVIRDAGIKILSFEDDQCVHVEAGCGLRNWPRIIRGTDTVSLMMNKIPRLPKKLDCPKLQVLLLQHNPDVKKIPDSFLQNLDKLRVLDLSKTTISTIPPSLCLLNNLHTLYFDSCKIFHDISVLGKLEKLVILSLRECCPQKIPEEIGYLTNLRLLDITDAQIVTISSKVISGLEELEELYMQCNFDGWGSEVEEAGEETDVCFSELTGLQFLTTLKVGISDAKLLPRTVEDNPNWEQFDICISSDLKVRESTCRLRCSHDYSRILTLSTTIDALPDWFIGVVTERAEKLQYRKCKGLDNILVEYDRGRLHDLRHLSVIDCHDNLKELMNAETRDPNEVVFEKLEEVHLHEVDIEKLCIGKLPHGSLRNLQLLDVRRCHNLVNVLLPSTLVEKLQNLEKILCAHMDGLGYVFESEVFFCKKLQEMRLCYLPKLTRIWNGHSKKEIFCNLKFLAVSECKILKSLFTSDVAQYLSQLEDLWVYSCHSLERLVEGRENTEDKNVIFPKLKNLVLEYLPWLRRLYSNSNGSATSLDIELPSLEHFYMRDCPQFSASYDKVYSQKQVNSIEHYSSLKERLWGNIEIESKVSEDQPTISEDGPGWKYDVFLSFKRLDTWKGITFDLQEQLQKRGIITFMDERHLEEGDVISPALLRAINDSRFAIIVLSQNYASSPWCLEELSKICQCMEDNERILPVFYNVDPINLRYQKRSFEDALTKHENSGRYGNKVQKWRDALRKVANLSGWHTQNFRSDINLTEAIVEYVCSKVQRILFDSRDFEVFESVKHVMHMVMKALEDGEVIRIGVLGLGGVGKTAMVKHVAALARRAGTFHHVIMVRVSQIPDLRKMKEVLAELLGVKLEEQTESGRAARLWKEIMRIGKILIILDDVWERIDLATLGIPSQRELQSCNSKILLTTRRMNVIYSMEMQVQIYLNTLSEEDSWILFRTQSRISFESIYFEEIARKVARECAGLPLALIVAARALGDKDPMEWKMAAQRLHYSQTDNPNEIGSEAFKCIKLSYDYLKDDDCKSFFLLCCLFPANYDIPIQDLINYGIGTGLFLDADTIKEARETAYFIINHLKNSSLLLDSEKDGRVRMHGVVWDVGSYYGLEHGFLVKAGRDLEVWPSTLHGGYSAVSLIRNHICKLPEHFVSPKLRILLLRGNPSIQEIPETFFQTLHELRVLDLSETSISLLPTSSLLTNLQVLYIDNCELLDDISIVGNLKKLEILSMKYSKLKELPREIGHLTNLRLLDITGASISSISSEMLSNFVHFEELMLGPGEQC